MSGTGPTYPPDKDEAQGPDFPGMTVQDPIEMVGYDPAIASAKDLPYKIQNEMLKVLQIQYANGGAVLVRNATGASLAAGPVTVSGHYAVHAQTGNPIFYVTAAKANGGVAANALLLTALANGTTGAAFMGGSFQSTLVTSSAALGDPVYLGSLGGLSLEEPEGDDDLGQEIGTVQSTTGLINGFVKFPHRFGTSSLQASVLTAISNPSTNIDIAVRALILMEYMGGKGQLLEAVAKDLGLKTSMLTLAKTGQ